MRQKWSFFLKRADSTLQDCPTMPVWRGFSVRMSWRRSLRRVPISRSVLNPSDLIYYSKKLGNLDATFTIGWIRTGTQCPWAGYLDGNTSDGTYFRPSPTNLKSNKSNCLSTRSEMEIVYSSKWWQHCQCKCSISAAIDMGQVRVRQIARNY